MRDRRHIGDRRDLETRGLERADRGLATGARAAIEKVGDVKLPAGVSDATAKALMQEVIGSLLMAEIKAGDCATVDELTRALAPLPSDNLGTLAALLLQLGGKDDGKKAEFRICPASPE